MGDIKMLSLDIATTTGWAFVDIHNMEEIKAGVIKLNSKMEFSVRLKDFREKLQRLLITLLPNFVVIEDVFAGNNIPTLKKLSKYAGVAQECCVSTLNIEPYIIHNNTVKSYFKIKKKEELFEVIKEVVDWEDATFKKHNDVTDAIAQLMCYFDQISADKKYKIEKDYGVLYNYKITAIDCSNFYITEV